MPIGPYGEIVGTTNCLDGVSESVLKQYKTKVNVPKNPKVVSEDEPKHKLTPSVYMFQMSMDTEKKLANTRDMRRPQKVELLDMSETTYQKFSHVSIDEPLFQPFPSEIFFQKSVPFKTHEVPLILRNNDKVPRLVKVVQADSPYFKIVAPLNSGDKVGPGLPTVYKIQFTPEDTRDYIHELVCITEREKFIVPVNAIGSRALLDFPDTVNFGICPVKHTTTKTLLVRNVGERDAKFTLSAEKPFSVKPANGILPVDESLQVTIEFTPTKTGDHQADLELCYDTGETILIDLYGGAQDSNVRLDKSSIRIENTYIGMAKQRTVSITNRTNVIAHFRWSEFATQESEDMQRRRFISDLTDSEKSETDRFLEECITDPSLRDKMSIIGRTFQNRRKNVTDNKMLFSDDVVKIDPPEGDIWPNSSVEITIIFKPDKAETYNRTGFCDITGRESRLPLRVTGLGVGPKVQFSCDSLDMGNIFVGSTHVYEIVMANKGDIDAIYTLLPTKTTFGKCFAFNPAESILMPGAHQAIQVKFSCLTLGNFEEEFEFQVDGAPEKIKVKFVGSVIGPTFHFDVNKIRFGTVSYGFLNTFTCTLSNTALVPMTFNLRVPGDGLADSSSASEMGSTLSEAGSLIPKEFEITPSRGTLQPQSDIRIEIDFCSTSLKKYDCSLVVDVDGVGEEWLTLPIEAKCVVPTITVMSPLIDYGRCFLRYPYERSVRLRNESTLPARYELLTQQIDETCPILYSSSQKKGVIEPHSIKEVPLYIEAQGLEELTVNAFFMIVGSQEAPLPVQIMCNGEGPVVHITPLSIDWGQIPVLTDVVRVVTLSNESLVPSKFTAHMIRPGSVWKIEPQQGEIPPEESFEISLTANVDDVVRFQDKLQINFLESQSRTIPVEAYGFGTTMVTEPKMESYMNLGPHFSNTLCVKKFKITNSGRRLQQLVWSTDGFPLVKPRRDPLYDARDIKYKNTPPIPHFQQPIFKLSPCRMELRPGESMWLTMEGLMNEPKEVRERLLCHSIIGRQGGKELIMTVDLYVEFICPLLEFSNKAMFFRFDKKPNDVLDVQIHELTLKNVSSLPLNVKLELKHPFAMLFGEGDASSADEQVVTKLTEANITLDIKETYKLRLQFDPAFKDDFHIRTIDEVLSVSYLEHPHIDYVSLRGEVYFPNLAFEKTTVDFGCVLNDTEVTRYVNVTNNSPMDVNYRWFFLIGEEPSIERRQRHIPSQTYVVVDDEDNSKNLPQRDDEIELAKAESDPVGEDENAKDIEQEKEAVSQPAIEVTGASRAGDVVESVVAADRVLSTVESKDEEMAEEAATSEPIADATDAMIPTTLAEVEELKKEPLIPDNERVDIIYPSYGHELADCEDEEFYQSRPQTRMGPMRTPPAINSTIKALLEGSRDTETPLGVEEVFDILPLYGTLKPGETEQITLTFYGHADIGSKAKALCEVEGGPTYEIELLGESSLVEYRFDATEIDYGKQMYDQVASSQITLINKGRVGFDFEALNMEPCASGRPEPGYPLLIPHKGYIEPLSEMVLTVKFLPGVPDKFQRSFKIQVAHFEPEDVTIFCEGIFPRITLDLPRYEDADGHYTDLTKQARENLTTSVSSKADVLVVHQEDMHYADHFVDASPRHNAECVSQQPSEIELQAEVERLTVTAYNRASHTNILEEGAIAQSLKNSPSKGKSKRRKNKPLLPDYVLDFSHVILGAVSSHIVRVTNPGIGPVSFSIDHNSTADYGFNVELDRVKQLPGAPDHEPIDFVVSFDPRGVNLSLAPVECLVPISIINGPQVNLRLKANVTMPDMEISSDILEFGEVICGNCQIITVQIHNHKHVRCVWSALPTEKELREMTSSADRHMPMHLRRKMKPEKPKPKTFELMPSTGVLMPGQRVNIQVKFMPIEERNYEQRLTIRLAQSSQRIMVMCRGRGLEPWLEFSRNLVEFGPVLPHSVGDEQDVIVRNPCEFPVEFYSLESDRQYLEEEKILRLMKGWDEYNTILLPPRSINEKLPEELTNFYEEQVKKVEAEQLRREQDEAAAAAASEVPAGEAKEDESATAAPAAPEFSIPTITEIPPSASHVKYETAEDEDEDDEEKIRDALSSVNLSELEITPVSAAIARHLGIDLTPDGKAARNRRGVAVIVHGAPMSGKTSTAVQLAKRYSSALLTIDGVVLEAISNGSTPAGIRARDLCAETARRKADELTAVEAEEADKKLSGGLSMEAVQAHTAGQAAIAGVHSNTQSIISNRKTSSMAGAGKDKHAKLPPGAQHAVGVAMADASSNSQVPMSPPPLAAPIARRLSISASAVGEEGLFSCVLPEELVVEIIADRIQLNDCHSGVVFDGLESLFCQHMFSSANCILKAFNNRKYLFFVTLKLDYAAMKAQEKKEQEDKELKMKQDEDEEKLRLEEMDEDEYDALSEEQKAQIDKKRLEIKRERRKREQEERLEKERIEKEKQEAELRRQEEERQLKRKKKADKDGKDDKSKDGKDAKQPAGGAKGKAAPAGSSDRMGNVKSQGGGKPHEDGRPESHMTHGSGEDMDRKKKGKGDKNRPISNEVPAVADEQTPVKEPISEAERILMQRFKTFEVTFKEITELVERWDRTIGAPRAPANLNAEGEEAHHLHPQSGRKGKKDKADKHGKHESQDKEVLKPSEKEKEFADSENVEGEDLAPTESEGDGIGVANLVIDVSDKATKPSQVVLQSPKLPAMDEVLDGLGLGVKGPPIPPMALFSVIPYPVKRKAPVSEAASHYAFIASGPDDPNVIIDDKSKDGEEDKAGTPDGKPDATTPTGKKKDRVKDKQKEDKDKRKSSAGKAVGRRGSNMATTPPPGGAVTPGSEVDGQSSTGEALNDGRLPKLNYFRWTVPAKGEVALRLRFFSEELGQYDQTMNFEIVGTRRRYQMYCRGVCAFPTISREPRIVFPSRTKIKKPDDILHKQYVLSTDVFEFGPLLAGQNRETMKANRFPEHNEKLTILNTSPVEAEMSFCYLEDSKGDCFMLDPPSMTLKPGEQQNLNMYAFPRSRDFYQDSLICCIKENPEPVIYKVSCHGCRPELEVDKRNLQFDKVLLHRKDTKTLFLRNRTLIPVGWRLSGMENLGDDFSVSQDSGIVAPNTEFALQAHFRATKPVITNRKSIRLEILDSDDQYGIVEAITIHVHAEAYDVALDMSFPKGTDGGIDFGTVRVGEEGKNQLTLKNKGKYEIAYSFTLEDVSGQSLPDVASLFVVVPQKGTLTSTDRPSTVQISFKSNTEITIKDLPILRCQVIEPNVSEGGETIASIPVKLSVKSVFSKFTIAPKADINFGSLLVNFKKTRTFTIENNGTFDFKYAILRAAKDVRKLELKPRPAIRGLGRDGSSSGKASAQPGGRPARRADSIRQEVGTTGGAAGGGGGQSRLQLGMFTIFPAFGIVLPNGHATVTIDCAPENTGRGEEDLSIDITERDPTDKPGGIPYKLIAEACIPGINITDIGAIFEEHRICRSLSIWQQTTTVDISSVYGEEENKFQFNNVVVGRRAKARFKLSNAQKVPCDVSLSLKPLAVKYGSKTVECFEIEPPLKLQIPAHSHTYASVLFTPIAMQHYTAVFEAAIDGVPAAQAKTRNLTFEVCGDGNLPRISIFKPNIRNKKGQPLLLFRKNLVGRQETLPLIIANEGSLISKVYIDLIDPDSVFTLVPTGDSKAFITDGYYDDGMKKPHTCSVLVNVGQQATFDVTYQPREVGRTQATVQLSVEDNQYEDSIVQLVGEGYQADVTLDNLHSVVQDTDIQYEDGSMADDDISAAKSNLIKFGDSAVGESKTLTFTMTNHSQTDCIKFVWPEHPSLKFSPTSGHIHASLHKDMIVTFNASEPASLSEENVQCAITRITFEKDISEIPDWDDRMRTVRWTDTVGPNDRPAKRKVVEIEPEPAYSEVAESTRTVQLLVTANADYSKFKCKTDMIKFRDTLMFQTRVFEVQVQNKGSIRLDYNWQVVMEDFMQASRSVTFAAETVAGSRAGSITPSVVGDTSLHMPFCVEPAFGSIPAGKKADFTVKFSPLDLNEYDARLVCTIPNLEEGKQGPVIAVKGRSLLPYCHFELSNSDYLSGARRNPEMRGPRGAPPGTTLDSNTRVIEIHSIGIGVRNSKRFSVVNPTTDNYSFQWINDDDPDPKITPSFACATPQGSIKTGKKQEIQFDFMPQDLGITESFWLFRIPEQSISVPFLLVGVTKDPAVMFDRSHLNFKALLIGHEATETVYMVNNETQPFNFNFEETSFFSAGYKDKLKVSPSSGTVPPQSRIPIRLHFTPRADYEVNFNIVCGVKRKIEPLRLNVKAEGYCMNAMVVCEDSAGMRVELTNEGVNSINLGSVEINEESMRNITIFNAGKFNFDYEWELTERSARSVKTISIDPPSGAIGFEDSTTCILSFLPRSRMTLVGCELVLKVAHGPQYHINVTGTGVAPEIHFSFQQHNFGPCFIYRAGMPTHSVVLRATNRDKKDISLDCLFESTQYLHHDFEAQVIPANHAVDITFSFYPREAVKYRESIVFEINGLSRQKIDILGTGTEMKVEVANPAFKNTKLGALRIGQVVKKQIQLLNNSPSAITFQLNCTPTTPELQDKAVMKISPTQPITLPARGGTCKVDVVFSPKSRIQQFTEEVMMECAGMFQPVFVLSGCCQGLEIGLDTDAIAFGSVVQKSQSSRKLVMSNTGDIGARFRWEAAKFLPDFSISPVSGYISPGMEVTFEVLFHPLDINPDIRYEKLKCVVEGANPLRLTLTGMCSGVPAFKEVQHFSSHVRNKETKNLMVINRTNQLWQLKPIIDGEYWSGPDWFVVEPQQSKPYELTYYPLTMSHENRKHQGTVFFPLPDGNGLLYNLVGTANEPKVASRITREVPCKTNAVELLPVTNWLKKPQRFRVKIEPMRPDKFDVGTSVKGLDYIDVPPNGKRDYKMNFYAHKEGITMCKVSFTNEATSEYQWIEVGFKATKGGPLDQITLSTPVRQSTQHSLVVKNPLTTHVTFTASCSINEVALPSQVSVPSESEGLLTLEFLPLTTRVQPGKIELNNADLGVYLYDLECTATAAGPEKALYFRCPLGSHQALPAKFLNFAKQKTEYTCKIENTTDFSCEKTLNAAPASSGGTETSVELTFEPSRIGEIRSQLVISSPVGGDYTFPIFATCTPPKPQGPFVIKSGSTTYITFRNNFPNTTAFTFTVDNPAFHVSKGGDNIRGKKDHRIVIGYDGTDSGTKAPVMGKLIVSCARSAGGSTPAQWIYYLKGVTQGA